MCWQKRCHKKYTNGGLESWDFSGEFLYIESVYIWLGRRLVWSPSWANLKSALNCVSTDGNLRWIKSWLYLSVCDQLRGVVLQKRWTKKEKLTVRMRVTEELAYRSRQCRDVLQRHVCFWIICLKAPARYVRTLEGCVSLMKSFRTRGLRHQGHRGAAWLAP